MIEIRQADRRDTDLVAALLAAQLSEHELAADLEQVRRGLEVALQTGAQLLVATEESRGLGACLANRIASVEHGGVVLFIEELYVTGRAPAWGGPGASRTPSGGG